MVGARAALALLMMLAVSGCASEDPPAADAPAASATGSTGPLPEEGVGLPRLGEPAVARLYFTADRALSWEPPQPGSVSIASPSAGLALGLDAPVFALPPQVHAMLVDSVDTVATLFVTSDGPQHTNGAFDIGVWGGATRGYALFGFTTGAPASAPATVQRFDVDLAFGDRRPVVVPAGDSLLMMVAGQFGREAGGVRLSVGGEHASYVDFTLRNYTVDPLAGVTVTEGEALTGSLGQALNPTNCDSVPGTTSLTHEVALRADAASLELQLRGQGALGHVDMDVSLLDGSTVLASTASPEGSEGIFLAAEALDGLQGKTLTAKVVSCGPGPGTYRVAVLQGVAPAAVAAATSAA